MTGSAVAPSGIGANKAARDLSPDWVNIVGIGLFHAAALLAFVPYFFSWWGVIACVVGIFVYGTIGINVFYHRYLTHKGFQCPKWLERVMAVLAVCSFQDTPARWVAVHRRHHEHSDDEPDPHTPLRSFLWAHVGWLLVKSPELSRYDIYSRYARDVLRDPFMRAFERQSVYLAVIAGHTLMFLVVGYGLALAFGSGSAEALRIGLSLTIWGVFVRTVIVWHTTWSVNSVTHLWGYRNYETDEQSRNNVLVGIAAMGEGWHNNHHADPRSARHGHLWWEIDVTYLTIRLFALLGLAWRITEPNLTPGSTRIRTRAASGS